MYFYNHQDQYREIEDFSQPTSSTAPKNRASENWGRGIVRRLIWVVSSLAYLCLLRFDEVLKIQAHEIELVDAKDGEREHIKLTLPFRKTHQAGGMRLVHLSDGLASELSSVDIPPFVMWPMPEEFQHICAVRSLAEWYRVTGIQHGFIFRKFLEGERLSEDPEAALVGAALSSSFPAYLTLILSDTRTVLALFPTEPRGREYP